MRGNLKIVERPPIVVLRVLLSALGAILGLFLIQQIQIKIIQSGSVESPPCRDTVLEQPLQMCSGSEPLVALSILGAALAAAVTWALVGRYLKHRPV